MQNKCLHTHIHTPTLGLTEEFDEAAVAVGLVVLLLEGAFVELLEAERTHKVLRVELLAHGGDAAARDRLLAAGAQRAAPLVVVRLAVRLAVVVEEAPVYKRREALLQNEKINDDGYKLESDERRATHPADEALGVPQGVESRDVVLQDGPGTATTFRSKHVKVVLPAERLPILLMET